MLNFGMHGFCLFVGEGKGNLVCSGLGGVEWCVDIFSPENVAVMKMPCLGNV